LGKEKFTSKFLNGYKCKEFPENWRFLRRNLVSSLMGNLSQPKPQVLGCKVRGMMGSGWELKREKVLPIILGLNSC
jgi:hypothetical protein